MGEWKEYKLGDLISINAKSIDRNYPHKQIEYLDTGSITKGKIEGFQYFAIEKAPSRAKRIVKDNDIIYSTVRPIQRHYGLVKNPKLNLVVSTGFAVLSCDEKRANPKFIYYFLTSDEVVNYLDMVAEGSTSAYPSLTPDVIADMDILLPPLPEQKSIASILSSLDDKIDLLHRQNKTLEALAETLFRQWFVEEAEGWEIGKLGDCGKIICGKTPSKKIHSYFGGGIPFIRIPDMHGKTFIFDTEDTLTEEGANSQQNKFLPPKSICVSCIATVGLVAMNAFNCQTNQQINSIVPDKEIYRYFLYLKLATMKEELLAMASGGTATDNLNTGDFSNIDIIKPDDKLLKLFHNQVQLYFDKIFVNQIQIRTLTHLRDTLLPKLMSGKVRPAINEFEVLLDA
ncbi:MAG: restriction endonuclease subunit S [Nitrospiraceae bacterium]|nr:restriction endonuclease subunit S [Nitrospiraceae bacterium]